MKKLCTIILLLFTPLFAYAEVLPRTVYAITPNHISNETVKENQTIILYAIDDKKNKNKDINIMDGESFEIQITEYIKSKRGKRDGYYKIKYNNNGEIIEGKMKPSTPKDMKDMAQKAGVSIVGKILKVPGFSQAVAVSKGLISPNEDQTRLKSAGKNLYESTPLTYVEKGLDFNVEEDGIVVLKLKVKEKSEE